jgi:hypothetical protein
VEARVLKRLKSQGLLIENAMIEIEDTETSEDENSNQDDIYQDFSYF